MKFLKLFAIFMSLLIISESKIKNDIGISIMQELEIKHCVIIDKYLKPAMNSMANVKFFARKNIFSTFMDTVFFFYYLKNGFFPNIKTAAFIKTSEMANVFNTFSNKLNSDFALPPFIWIIFEDESNIFNQLSRFYIPYNCQFFLIKNINATYYDIAEIYNTKMNSDLFKTQTGYWSYDKGLTISPEYFYQRRLDMRGTQLSWSYQYKEFCFMKEECKHAEIIFIMRKMLNYTTKLWWLPDYSNVSIELSRSLEGDFRSVVINSDYFRTDFLGPTFEIKGYFHIKNIGEERNGIFAFAAPFSRYLWTYVYFYLSLSAVCTVTNEYLKSKNFKINQLLTFIFIPFDIIFNQSTGINLRNDLSNRLTLLAIKLTAVIIVPAYTGAITSYLTISITKLPFTDLATFAEDGTYKTSGLIDTYSQNFFLRSSDPTVQKIKQRQLINNTPNDLDDLYKLICNRKYAFVAYNKELFYKRLGKHACDIIQIPKPIFSTMSGIPLRVKSPYRKIFRKNLILFFSSGVIKRFRIIDEEKVRNVMKEDYVPIDLPHILPLIYLLSSLIFVSFLVLLGEIKFRP